MPTPGPWEWVIHDRSMASLEGPGGMTMHVMSVSPCEACQKNADPKEWTWGRCTTPSEDDARVLAASWDLLEALEECTDQLALLAKDPKNNPWVQQGLAAIAKATGAAQ